MFTKKHAYFNILYYNGNAIMDLLNAQKDDKTLYDNGRYHIKLLSKKDKEIGNKIEIMLPTIDPEPK